MLTLEQLMEMNGSHLQRVMANGHPLVLEELAGHQYLGVDLSLSPLMRKVLWHTFRKTFYREPGGPVRGWNVRMEQTGVRGTAIPLKDRQGRERTFGHYRLCSARGESFPHRWRGSHFLDYGCAGNAWSDPARFAACPLVAVNEGQMELLLGWEVFRVGPAKIPTQLFWALERQGPLEQVVQPPRAAPAS